MRTLTHIIMSLIDKWNICIDYMRENTRFNLSEECPDNIVFNDTLYKICDRADKKLFDKIAWDHILSDDNIYKHDGKYITESYVKNVSFKSHKLMRKMDEIVHETSELNGLIRSLHKLNCIEFDLTATIPNMFKSLPFGHKLIVWEKIIDKIELSDIEYIIWANLARGYEPFMH